jgi:Uma2 family endonuclease
MGAARILLSAEEFDNYPFEEDKRYELDDGELIEMTRPAYQHNQALQNLLVELVLYFRKNPIGQALVSENLYALTPNTRLAPDVAVIPRRPPRGIAEGKGNPHHSRYRGRGTLSE